MKEKEEDIQLDKEKKAHKEEDEKQKSGLRNYSEIFKKIAFLNSYIWDPKIMDISKFSPFKQFTASVFWQYIGSQYFPYKLFKIAENIKNYFNKNLNLTNGYDNELNKILLLEDNSISEIDKALNLNQDEIRINEENLSKIFQKLDSRMKGMISENIEDNSSFAPNYSEDLSKGFHKHLDFYMREENIQQDLIWQNKIYENYLRSLEKAQEKRITKAANSLAHKGSSSNFRNEPKNKINYYIETNAKNIKNMNDVVCQICNDGDYDNNNLIVLCSECNIAVHQECYGILNVPDNDWICDACFEFGHKKGRLLTCPFCPIRGGAMRKTNILKNKNSKRQHSNKNSGVSNHIYLENSLIYNQFQNFTEEELTYEVDTHFEWCHMSCALFLPELVINLNEKSIVISGFDSINEKRFQMKCKICGNKKVGFCIQCAKGKCKISFHAECGRIAGYFMEINKEEEAFLSEGNKSNTYLSYCEVHRPHLLRRQINSIMKHNIDEILKFCKTNEKCIASENKHSRSNKGVSKILKKSKFSSSEKEKLFSKVRHYIKLMSKMDITIIKKPTMKKQNSFKYKVLNNESYIDYQTTASAQHFPWNLIKVGDHPPLVCFLKYSKIIKDSILYEKKIVSRLIKSSKLKKDNKLYCICKTKAHEDNNIDLMIECSGGQKCPGNGWFHLKCVKMDEIPQEQLDKLKFYCTDCKIRKESKKTQKEITNNMTDALNNNLKGIMINEVKGLECDITDKIVSIFETSENPKETNDIVPKTNVEQKLDLKNSIDYNKMPFSVVEEKNETFIITEISKNQEANAGLIEMKVNPISDNILKEIPPPSLDNLIK